MEQLNEVKEYCDCGNWIEVESGEDIHYNNGFLMRTVRICISCKTLDIWHCSMGDHIYSNYEGSFEGFNDEDEKLESWINHAEYELKKKTYNNALQPFSYKIRHL